MVSWTIASIATTVFKDVENSSKERLRHLLGQTAAFERTGPWSTADQLKRESWIRPRITHNRGLKHRLLGSAISKRNSIKEG